MRLLFLLLFMLTISCGHEPSATKVGQSYIDLLNRIGKELTNDAENDVMKLIAKSCTKKVNGAVWFEKREEFLPQLLSTGQKIGHWVIHPLAIIPGADDRTVVVHFRVTSNNPDSWITMVILRFDDSLQIREIVEVFNKQD